MNPAISYELTKARSADLRQQAQRETQAGAARRARRARARRPVIHLDDLSLRRGDSSILPMP